MRTLQSPTDLLALVGHEVATSEWLTVTQDQVDRFADATGDRQWIHVDEARARSGPYGGTIAHGYFTLSLLPWFFDSAMAIEQMRLSVNYGLDKVRFPAPVPVGSRLRASFRLLRCDPIDDGLQVMWQVTVVREGGDKPVCVVEALVRLYP